MAVSSLLSLLALSEDISFHSGIKKRLLNDYREQIHNDLKPQMGGFIDINSVSLSIISSHIKDQNSLELKCSVFYIEQIGGCNCHDEPHEENGYCEMKLLWTDAGITLSF